MRSPQKDIVEITVRLSAVGNDLSLGILSNCDTSKMNSLGVIDQLKRIEDFNLGVKEERVIESGTTAIHNPRQTKADEFA